MAEVFINSKETISFVLTSNGSLHACRNSDDDPACVHVFRVDLSVYAHTWGNQRSVSGDFCIAFYLLFSIPHWIWVSWLFQLAGRLVSPQCPPVCTAMCMWWPALNRGSGDSNSGPYSCAQGTLAIDLPPQCWYRCLRTFLDLIWVYEFFVCMFVWAPCVCLVPAEIRRRFLKPWKWS